eukprot:149509-Prymnesium_polylepis.1
MVALILLKLPEKCTTIKTMIIQSDRLPTIKALIEMLKTETDFFGGDPARPPSRASASARASSATIAIRRVTQTPTAPGR